MAQALCCERYLAEHGCNDAIADIVLGSFAQGVHTVMSIVHIIGWIQPCSMRHMAICSVKQNSHK